MKQRVATSGAWQTSIGPERVCQRLMNPLTCAAQVATHLSRPGNHRLRGYAGLRAGGRQALQGLLGTADGEISSPLEVSLQTAQRQHATAPTKP
jgi:hypothetical protein